MNKKQIDTVFSALSETSRIQDSEQVEVKSVIPSVMHSIRSEQIESEEEILWNHAFSPLLASFSIAAVAVLATILYVTSTSYTDSLTELLVDSNDSYITMLVEEY